MSQWCCVTLMVFVPKDGERLSTRLRAHEDVVMSTQTDPTSKFGPSSITNPIGNKLYFLEILGCMIRVISIILFDVHKFIMFICFIVNNL